MIRERSNERIAYAGALLAIFLTIPISGSTFGQLGYSIFGWVFRVEIAFYIMLSFLVISVYSYSLYYLISWKWLPILGDIAYGLAMSIPIVYIVGFVLAWAVVNSIGAISSVAFLETFKAVMSIASAIVNLIVIFYTVKRSLHKLRSGEKTHRVRIKLKTGGK